MQLEPFVLQTKTLGQLLDEAIARNPENDAVIYVEQEVRQTWREFGESVDQLAKGFMALGIQPGEKIALWATNIPHWVTVMFASAKIGAVLLLVNTSYRENELAFILKNSECENILIAEENRGHDCIYTLYSIVPELRQSVPGDLKSDVYPSLKRAMAFGEERHRGMLSLEEIMALAPQISDEEYALRQKGVDPDDVVNMQYTSGTTGFPKGVLLSHSNILNNGYWIGRMQNFSPADRVCIPVPLFHCFGCVLGVMASVNHGATMVVLESFSPVHVLTTVESEKCTALYGVPAMFTAILEHKVFSKFNLSSLRTGIMAGSVCPEPLMRRVIDQMHMREITITYGLTEASPGMTMTQADEEFERRVTTVGRAMPGIEVKVVDPDTMEEVSRGVSGEVVCRGYNVMKGYYGMPEETAAAITPDGWLHSGDIGVMDEDGYLVITGRIKDVIIRGGENVYPREVEEFLLGMPEIQDVQVVGVQSHRYGEEVCAFIMPKQGCELQPEDVKDFCRKKIAGYKIPKYISMVTEFPMTASGKVQKYKLRAMASEIFPEAMQRHRPLVED